MSVTVHDIDQAAAALKGVIESTPLQLNKRLSKKHKATVYIKREDLQEVRSFKIRGAYYKMSKLVANQRAQGVVCASAGNHSQGVAYACAALKTHGVIFMPTVTPKQKVDKVAHFGGEYVTIKLVGNTFDEAYQASMAYANVHNSIYVHPFDDDEVIAGQGTIGREIYEELGEKVDLILTCEGGGGLTAGIASYIKAKSPRTELIACEPEGAASLFESHIAHMPVTLPSIDTFVDGAAVKSVGKKPFEIMKESVKDIIKVPEGQVATTMIELYQNEGIIAEPAGALAISALDIVDPKLLIGKTIVCTLSGGNNDIMRYPEVIERSLIYQGLKHYFIVEFEQKPGQLKKLLSQVLGPDDDIVLFEYMKKNNKEKGPAFIGLQLTRRTDYDGLIERFETSGLEYQIVNPHDMMYRYLV